MAIGVIGVIGVAIANTMPPHCAGFETGMASRTGSWFLYGCRSSVSSVFVDPLGARLIVNYSAPDLPDDPGWLPVDEIQQADVVLCDSSWPTGARRAFALAKTAGKPSVLDADLPAPCRSLVAQATHVAFCSESLREYAGHDDWQRSLYDIRKQESPDGFGARIE